MNEANPLMNVVRRIKPLHAMALRMKAADEVRRAFADVKRPPVLIYQMGKVGSSTVAHSLDEIGIGADVFHLHFLSEDLEHYGKVHRQAGLNPLPYHMYLGEAMREMLQRKPEARVRIISLVRDPVAWAVSNVFQNPFFTADSVQDSNGAVDPYKAGNYLINQLKQPTNFDYVNQWFDRELKTVFGIDVFAEPFPVDTGFALYRQDRAEALVIRLEDLSTTGPQAIGAFLGLGGRLEIKKANVREDTDEADRYREVRERVRLSDELCQRIYQGRLVRHFYNQEMMDAFVRRWTGAAQ